MRERKRMREKECVSEGVREGETGRGGEREVGKVRHA
jgi:hypothetical protein